MNGLQQSGHSKPLRGEGTPRAIAVRKVPACNVVRKCAPLQTTPQHMPAAAHSRDPNESLQQTLI